MISVTIILLVLVAIQSCSVINLSPHFLFNKAKFKKFTELQEHLQWDNFSMQRATENKNDGIRYYSKNNFFLVSSHPYFLKIDSAGNTAFELENTNALKFLDAVNCYVITENGIYDFSAENPALEPFEAVLNKDRDVSHQGWVEDLFGKFYNTADVVLFSVRTAMVNGEVVYFRTNGKWTKLYTSKSSSFIYAEANEIRCRINNEEVSAKLQEVHFLKDVHKATYSNELRYTDAYITPFNSDNSFFPDQKLEYVSKAKLKTLAFEKQTYTTEGYFNPGLPSHFYGMGYYGLEIGSAILNFKTVASKSSFGGEINTDLYLFESPAKFANKTRVYFLAYDYSTNFHENKKKGLYIIKNK